MMTAAANLLATSMECWALSGSRLVWQLESGRPCSPFIRARKLGLGSCGLRRRWTSHRFRGAGKSNNSTPTWLSFLRILLYYIVSAPGKKLSLLECCVVMNDAMQCNPRCSELLSSDEATRGAVRLAEKLAKSIIRW